MGTKISNLPVSTTPPNTVDLVPIVQGGATKQTTLGALSAFYVTLAQLAASAGASLIGFIQAGTGAVARTVQAKERDLVNVQDFLPPGYVTDGSIEYTTQ